MSDRIRLNDLNDDQLDALYGRIAELEQQLADADAVHDDLDHTCEAVAGRDRAEAAIARVRALATQWAVLRNHGSAATELRAALDEQPTT
ncbi:hypothetical protein PUR34_41480 [Streptomyces sp. JV185]|uniref:hypothetical protein n=1 Tax=Streptomyces sp. JV185 TaxID=858638 RepID=UPI002E78FBF3|nr:hypothetical protein [Streptomyces sp. JV185]MEE1774477.1 hypothetical protein [Streptomyces sp. JV185]